MDQYLASSTIPSEHVRATNLSVRLFQVRSDLYYNSWYYQSFGSDQDLPNCNCPDWQQTPLPCQHFFAIFRDYPEINWESFPCVYRESPFLLLDQEVSYNQASGLAILGNVQEELPEVVLDYGGFDNDEHNEQEEMQQEDGQNVPYKHMRMKCLRMLQKLHMLTSMMAEDDNGLTEMYTHINALSSKFKDYIPHSLHDPSNKPTVGVKKKGRGQQEYVGKEQEVQTDTSFTSGTLFAVQNAMNSQRDKAGYEPKMTQIVVVLQHDPEQVTSSHILQHIATNLVVKDMTCILVNKTSQVKDGDNTQTKHKQPFAMTIDGEASNVESPDEDADDVDDDCPMDDQQSEAEAAFEATAPTRKFISWTGYKRVKTKAPDTCVATFCFRSPGNPVPDPTSWQLNCHVRDKTGISWYKKINYEDLLRESNKQNKLTISNMDSGSLNNLRSQGAIVVHAQDQTKKKVQRTSQNVSGNVNVIEDGLEVVPEITQESDEQVKQQGGSQQVSRHQRLCSLLEQCGDTEDDMAKPDIRIVPPSNVWHSGPIDVSSVQTVPSGESQPAYEMSSSLTDALVTQPPLPSTALTSASMLQPAFSASSQFEPVTVSSAPRSTGISVAKLQPSTAVAYPHKTLVPAVISADKATCSLQVIERTFLPKGTYSEQLPLTSQYVQIGNILLPILPCDQIVASKDTATLVASNEKCEVNIAGPSQATVLGSSTGKSEVSIQGLSQATTSGKSEISIQGLSKSTALGSNTGTFGENMHYSSQALEQASHSNRKKSSSIIQSITTQIQHSITKQMKTEQSDVTQNSTVKAHTYNVFSNKSKSDSENSCKSIKCVERQTSLMPQTDNMSKEIINDPERKERGINPFVLSQRQRKLCLPGTELNRASSTKQQNTTHLGEENSVLNQKPSSSFFKPILKPFSVKVTSAPSGKGHGESTADAKIIVRKDGSIVVSAGDNDTANYLAHKVQGLVRNTSGPLHLDSLVTNITTTLTQTVGGQEQAKEYSASHTVSHAAKKEENTGDCQVQSRTDDIPVMSELSQSRTGDNTGSQCFSLPTKRCGSTLPSESDFGAPPSESGCVAPPSESGFVVPPPLFTVPIECNDTVSELHKLKASTLVGLGQRIESYDGDTRFEAFQSEDVKMVAMPPGSHLIADVSVISGDARVSVISGDADVSVTPGDADVSVTPGDQDYPEDTRSGMVKAEKYPPSNKIKINDQIAELRSPDSLSSKLNGQTVILRSENSLGGRCPSVDMSQALVSTQPSKSPAIPGTQTLSTQPNISPAIPGTQTLSTQPRKSPAITGTLTLSTQPSKSPAITGTLTLSTQPSMSPAIPGTQTLSTQPSMSPAIPGTQTLSTQPSMSPAITGTQTLSTQPSMSPAITGTQTLSTQPSMSPAIPMIRTLSTSGIRTRSKIMQENSISPSTRQTRGSKRKLTERGQEWTNQRSSKQRKN